MTTLIRQIGRLQVMSLARLPMPVPLGWAISFLLLDFAAYLSHVMLHRLPPLWALHGVHHADEQVTGATGLLHHPLETLANSLALLAFCVVFGVPVAIIGAYGLVSFPHAILTHANIAIPYPVDRLLRLLICTPDMHRTHHSRDMAEGNANFGQIFPFWDWIYGTYLARPALSESGLIMGLPGDGPAPFTASALLAQPFRNRRPRQAVAAQLPS